MESSKPIKHIVDIISSIMDKDAFKRNFLLIVPCVYAWIQQVVMCLKETLYQWLKMQILFLT